MATPSVFFGVSNYHSERWDRRQIFNRQAITGVNTAAPPSTNPEYCHRSHRSAIDTVKQAWNPFRRPNWLRPCLHIWTTWWYKAAVRHRPDLYEAFIANTGSLCHKHMPAHEIRPQKNPNYLTRTKSFPGVHLYLLPRSGVSGAVPLLPLYFFVAWTSTTLSLAASLFHLGNIGSGCCTSSRVIAI
jgi:hypothetical protein